MKQSMCLLWSPVLSILVAACGDDGGGAADAAPQADADPDMTSPLARLVYPRASSTLPTGTLYPIIAAGEDETAIAEIEILIDGEVVSTGAGLPTLWRPEGVDPPCCGARSVQTLPGDGTIEWIVTTRNAQKAIGLADADTGPLFEDIDFGLQYTPFGGFFGAGSAGNPYAGGDRFRIEVEGTAVRVFQNDVLHATLTRVGSAPLFVDTFMPGVGAAFSDVTISIDGDPAEPVEWSDPMGVIESPALAYHWDTTGTPDGAVAFSVRVTDRAGNTDESEPLTLVVDNTLPTCNFVAPADSATVSGTVSLQATGADANYNLLAFFVDDVNLLSEHNGQMSATFGWNSATVANGSHDLLALVLDRAGNRVDCEITVTVNN